MYRLTLILAALAALVSPAHAQPPELAFEVVAENLDLPLYMTAPAGDPRLFVVEQGGLIRIVEDGEVRETPFLDLRDAVSTGGEQGLLGLAFHPDYAENGRFFVDYTDVEGATRVVAYQVGDDPNVADPASAKRILVQLQPAPNHNGGWIAFGPDGYLYVALGDGGGGGDPDGHGQNRDSLLGKILRLDVDGGDPYAIPPGNPFAGGGGAPEIFVLGMRNPWRNAFDGNLLYLADVGQGDEEEVSVVDIATEAGANLGWNHVEGTGCYIQLGCVLENYHQPIYTYPTGDGCSITGGYVYRGAAIPALVGQYVFADYCTGELGSLRYVDGVAGDVTDWGPRYGSLGLVTSFGLDGAGELYVTTTEGRLLKLVPAG